MDNASPFQAAWQWRKFAICHLLALLLLILWLWGPTRELMNGFDFWLFDKLNGSLALNETWLKLWGLLSTRPFDAVVGVLLLCLLIRGDWLLPANQVRRLTFGFIVTLLILVVIRVLYAKIAHHLHWQHASLSMLMDKAIHLSDHFPDWERVWEIKDRSKRSFPGDHASVLLVWALFMSLFARRAGQFLLIWTLAVLFMMPRLVAGAHWGQDDYIGGLQMALLALAWGCYTPRAAKASGWLVQVTEPLFRLLAKLPLIGRLGVVRDSA
ncbi:phosphatase PAP2 family protein [Pseudomonas aeruginosa]|nr:phosphatase PAP2 family protein [Pseudomonas aeruginosa]